MDMSGRNRNWKTLRALAAAALLLAAAPAWGVGDDGAWIDPNGAKAPSGDDGAWIDPDGARAPSGDDGAAIDPNG
jgi:hypothetical protein